MHQPTINHVISEFLNLNELLDDAYWEASSIEHKDLIYDIISQLTKEIAELNKLSIQDHHYPYEFITEGIRRITPKVISFEEQIEVIVKRTQTQIDMKEILSNVILILETQL